MCTLNSDRKHSEIMSKNCEVEEIKTFRRILPQVSWLGKQKKKKRFDVNNMNKFNSSESEYVYTLFLFV